MSTCTDVGSFVESKTSVVQTSNVGFISKVSDYLVVRTGPGWARSVYNKHAVPSHTLTWYVHKNHRKGALYCEQGFQMRWGIGRNTNTSLLISFVHLLLWSEQDICHDNWNRLARTMTCHFGLASIKIRITDKQDFNDELVQSCVLRLSLSVNTEVWAMLFSVLRPRLVTLWQCISVQLNQASYMLSDTHSRQCLEFVCLLVA